MDLAILEYCREHLGVGLVDCRQRFIFFQEEHCRSSSQHIKPVELSLFAKERQHLGTLDLVEMRGILLNGNKRIGHKAGLLQRAVTDHKRDTVGRILTGYLLPYQRFLEESCKRVQVAIKERVADHLHILLVYLDLADSLEESDLGGIQIRKTVCQCQRICTCDGICKRQ